MYIIKILLGCIGCILLAALTPRLLDLKRIGLEISGLSEKFVARLVGFSSVPHNSLQAVEHFTS